MSTVRPAQTSETRYMRFERVEVKGRKTPVVFVVSKSSGALLGRIAWYGPWRQFCFWPEPRTVFNSECMHDIQETIAKLRAERREQPPTCTKPSSDRQEEPM